IFQAVSGVNRVRRRAMARFAGYRQARDRARAIKERAIEDLPAQIDALEAAITERGGQVHHAEDGPSACRIITDIARRYGARRAVKSKSMTSEEVDLNAALEAAGIEVRETDLGEYILQLSGDRPSHIIAPIIHKSVEEVRQAFLGFGVDEVPREPAQLTQLARRLLRREFLAADLGITGANFLLADTGTVVIVENEGNGRMTTQLPPVHVVLAGIEKVLPKADDLLPFLQLLPRSATGQLQTSYLSFISGPGWSASPFSQGKRRRFHLVLLDNGRTRMREDPLLREALYCIRCGACMTVCPPYQVVGGHVYGGPTYHSGIGNAWEAGVRDLDTAAGFNELCTTCSRCQDVCPVRIDIPWMNSVLRDRIAAAGLRRRGRLERVVFAGLLPDDEERGVRLTARLFANPARLYHLLKKTAPLSTWLARLWPTRLLLRGLIGLDGRRRLPLPAAVRLSEWHRRRGGRVVSGAAEAGSLEPPGEQRPAVVLFADCHTDYVDVEVGKAAVGALEQLGIEVVVVAGHCCGRAALSQGMLATARRHAESLQAVLGPLASAGHTLLGIEPSCLSAVVEDHAKLLAGNDTGAAADLTDAAAGTAATARACEEILTFLGRKILAHEAGSEGKIGWGEAEDGRCLKAIFHGHCQQKTAGWMPAAVELLESIPGIDLRTTSTECCGMAGSFGYKRRFAGISRELGGRLLAEMRDLEGDARQDGEGVGAATCPVRWLACGTSCRAQMRDLDGREVSHPVELVAERLEACSNHE
ncbi:MAG: LUD domain-containing protein, partial [Acidobacteriota bacterium]